MGFFFLRIQSFKINLIVVQSEIEISKSDKSVTCVIKNLKTFDKIIILLIQFLCHYRGIINFNILHIDFLCEDMSVSC